MDDSNTGSEVVSRAASSKKQEKATSRCTFINSRLLFLEEVHE
jgi:hypothetical protein